MLGRNIDLGNPVSDHPLNRGLLSWWLPLANNSFGAARLFDLKGGNHGTLTNGPTWGASPAGHAAVSLDGSNDQIDCGPASNLALASGFSFSSTFMSRGSTGFRQALLSRAGNSGYGLYWNASAAQVDVVIALNAVTVAGSLSYGRWYQATVSYDSSFVGRMFFDGKFVGTLSPGGGASTSAGNFWIGRLANSSTTIMNGLISDVRVWDRAIADDDAASYYQQSLRGHPDTLRRFSRRAYLFASGGSSPVVTNPSPVTSSASVVAGTSVISSGQTALSLLSSVPSAFSYTSRTESPDPVVSSANIPQPTQSITSVQSLTSITSSIGAQTGTIENSPSPTSSSLSTQTQTVTIGAGQSSVAVTSSVVSASSEMTSMQNPIVVSAGVPLHSTTSSVDITPTSVSGLVASIETVLNVLTSPISVLTNVPEVNAFITEAVVVTPNPISGTLYATTPSTSLNNTQSSVETVSGVTISTQRISQSILPATLQVEVSEVSTSITSYPSQVVVISSVVGAEQYAIVAPDSVLLGAVVVSPSARILLLADVATAVFYVPSVLVGDLGVSVIGGSVVCAYVFCPGSANLHTYTQGVVYVEIFTPGTESTNVY